MEKSKIGIPEGVGRPGEVKKKLKTIKIYFNGKDYAEIQQRAQQRGYSSVGLYLKKVEAENQELLYLKTLAVQQCSDLIRKYRISRENLKAEGLYLS